VAWLCATSQWAVVTVSYATLLLDSGGGWRASPCGRLIGSPGRRGDSLGVGPLPFGIPEAFTTEPLPEPPRLRPGARWVPGRAAVHHKRRPGSRTVTGLGFGRVGDGAASVCPDGRSRRASFFLAGGRAAPQWWATAGAAHAGRPRGPARRRKESSRCRARRPPGFLPALARYRVRPSIGAKRGGGGAVLKEGRVCWPAQPVPASGAREPSCAGRGAWYSPSLLYEAHRGVELLGRAGAWHRERLARSCLRASPSPRPLPATPAPLADHDDAAHGAVAYHRPRPGARHVLFFRSAMLRRTRVAAVLDGHPRTKPDSSSLIWYPLGPSTWAGPISKRQHSRARCAL